MNPLLAPVRDFPVRLVTAPEIMGQTRNVRKKARNGAEKAQPWMLSRLERDDFAAGAGMSSRRLRVDFPAGAVVGAVLMRTPLSRTGRCSNGVRRPCGIAAHTGLGMARTELMRFMK